MKNKHKETATPLDSRLDSDKPTPGPSPADPAPKLTLEKITFREQITWPGDANCSELPGSQVADWQVLGGCLMLTTHDKQVRIVSMAGVEIFASL